MVKRFFFPRKWFLITILCSCLFVYIGLKLLFVFYGYIATEEGSMIFSQQLAYQGLLPFIHYDGWNSFLNDYFVGWFQLFLPATIFHQRIIGLIYSLLVLFFTLKISRVWSDHWTQLWTLIFLTFGSFTHLYLSTIPYSELTMTLFLTIGFYLISKQLIKNRPKLWVSIAAVIIFTVAVFIRIQSIPILVSTATFLTWFHRFSKKSLIGIGLTILCIISLLSFYFIRYDASQFIYGFTWPFSADKILIYQKGTSITFSSLFVFVQELFRDYGPLLIIMCASFFIPKKQFFRQSFLILLFISGIWFILTGLVHKPPYASYIYPAVPFLALIAGYTISYMQKIVPSQFLITVIALLLFPHFILFPHYKFLKTDWKSRTQTPHQFLQLTASSLKRYVKPNDEILSFYTPLTLALGGTPPRNFIRDRFSMSLLPQKEASTHRLFASIELLQYITLKKVPVVAYTDHTLQYAGQTESEIRIFLDALNTHYQLVLRTSDIASIEHKKAGSLYVYVKK